MDHLGPRWLALLAVVPILLGACGAPSSVGATPAIASEPPLVLHWMSFSHHREPRNQLLLEGGEPDSFTELRLVAPDGAVVAAATPVASAAEPMRICSGSKSSQSPRTYGALRVALDLGTQQQLTDVIAHPDRYRIEVLTGGRWQSAGLVHECDAQE